MKHRLVILIALLLSVSVLALCAGCSKPADPAVDPPRNAPAAADPAPSEPSGPAPAAGRNAALDAAFAAGETFRLEPADLPAVHPGEDWMAVDLSPDGQAVLWRKTDRETHLSSLCLTRGEKVIPVVFSKERGIGDPFNKEPLFSDVFFGAAPGQEGLSWSADGRLIALSDAYVSTQRIQSPDVALIDTETGDLYLADSYVCRGIDGSFENRDSPDAGIVITSRIDRSGKYCYYLRLLLNAGTYAFCRVPAEGGKPEVLYSMKRDDSQPFDITARSSLTETADGSWLLTGLNGRESGKTVRHSLIRFSPAGDAWSAAVTPVGIPCLGWNACFSTSPVSGYSIAAMQNPVSAQSMSLAQSSTAASADLLKASVMPSLYRRVNMLRVLPGEAQRYDVWWLQETEENHGSPEARPGEPFLLVYKTMHSQLTDDDAEELLKWGPEIDPETGLPAGYDPLSDQRGESGFRQITALCLSPDGYYCLAAAADGNGRTRAWLISLETMAVRKVDMPESLDLQGFESIIMQQDYYPLMTWNEDGTLLILNTAARRTEAFRLAYSPAAE